MCNYFTGSVHNESIHSRRSTFVSKPSRSTIRIVRVRKININNILIISIVVKNMPHACIYMLKWKSNTKYILQLFNYKLIRFFYIHKMENIF